MVDCGGRSQTCLCLHINDEIYFLFIINAPITPGTHPHRVRRNTIRTDPHPLSMTARGGQMMQTSTRKQPIVIVDLRLSVFDLLIYENSLLPTACSLFPPLQSGSFAKMTRRVIYLRPALYCLLPAAYCLNKWSAACSIFSFRSGGYPGWSSRNFSTVIFATSE